MCWPQKAKPSTNHLLVWNRLPPKKVFISGEKTRRIGYTGSLEFSPLVQQNVDQWQAHEPIPKPIALSSDPDQYYELILVEADRKHWLTTAKTGVWLHITAPFIALNSGSPYAYGALFQGATAKQAVEAACRFDVYSGGEIVTLSLAAAK